jgi:hypothetical protein
MSVIISQIIGGLGNQMFQYAVGRAISAERGDSFKLDISGFANYSLHQGFELQRIFNCPVQIAAESDVRQILGWQFLPIIRKIIKHSSLVLIRKSGYIVEPYFHYWPEITKIPKDCYLTGYWQSEKYFKKSSSLIRVDFTFNYPLENYNAELADQIDQVNAVSLHVRRGDYVNNAKTSATHGLCSLDYYRAAIQHIIKQVENPHFFVFSDDIAWVKNNLKIDSPHQFVDHNSGEESYNDMRLMSLCKHNIIANSSFSWWAAWLNTNPQKIVIAPQNWFSKKVNISDLIPCGWIRM